MFQAVGLVVLVIFVFLQDWRATLVPAITIPVSLIGTFAVMAAFGYSINLITLFGLVLAIGIVVDDAIVVVENTMRHISRGQSSRDAAVLAMQEVSGPVIATTLVLLAVFVPSAFLGGITGQLYRQFALTISASTVLSSINALTLSPAICALILRPQGEVEKGWIYRWLRPFFRGFNFGYEKSERAYEGVVGALDPPRGDRPVAVRRPRCLDRLGVSETANRIPASRRPRLRVLQRAASRRCLAGADQRRHRSDR